MSYVGIGILCLLSGWSLGWTYGDRLRSRAIRSFDGAVEQAKEALDREAAAMRALQAALLLMERVISVLPVTHQKDLRAELMQLRGLLENVNAPLPPMRPGRAHLKVVVH